MADKTDEYTLHGITMRTRSGNDGMVSIQMGEFGDETDVSDLRGVQPFADHEDETAAFADPRYRTSLAFRNLVAKRLKVTHG